MATPVIGVRRASIVLTLFFMLMSTASFASAQASLLTVTVNVPATASPGEIIEIFLEASFNGTLVNSISFSLRVSYVDGGHIKWQYPWVYRFSTGVFYANYTIPKNATGVYWVQASALYHKFSATDVAGVTIVPYGTAQSSSSVICNLSSWLVALIYAVPSIALTIVAIALAILLRKKVIVVQDR